MEKERLCALPAERLVRTETSHLHNEADKTAYTAAGVEWYEFMATLDARTCAECGALDGKRFKISEAQTGVNYPPLHPNDRCTTVEWDPEDALDWYNSGGKMPERMTYEKWYQKQTAEHGEEYIELSRKKDYNSSADKIQYQSLVNDLGSNAPSSFEAFQELKYSSRDGYRQFKAYARGIKSGELSPLANFGVYQSTSKGIDEMLVGLLTTKGTLVTGKSEHFINRVIGSIEQRRSGVSIESVKTRWRMRIELTPDKGGAGLVSVISELRLLSQ